jgi:riboflavin kinase/FMN adenylyltransferase
MIVLRGHPFEWEVAAPTATTIGVFDGVHAGHRAVLRDLVDTAGGLMPTAVTFDPHPLSILSPQVAPLLLTDVDQRIEQFAQLGVEVSGVLGFAEIRGLTAAEFTERVLCDSLMVKRVVVGADFRFGKGRDGDCDFLRDEGRRLGFEVDVVDLLRGPGGVVSSTRIREHLLAGNVEAAAEMLTRPYQLNGIVIEGDRRGREIGFPTANLAVAADRLVPAQGVYAAWVHVHGIRNPGVVNIGVRPTFAGQERRIEAHIFDFDSEIYGEKTALDFVAHLRKEQRFEGVEGLKAQIGRDVHDAREILS